MFSVDNFYSYFNDKYGWFRTGIFPFTAQTHGEKNLYFFRPYGDFTESGKVYPLHDPTNVTFSLNGCSILYDQEPFDWHHCVSTYRDSLLDATKNQSFSLLNDNDIMAYEWRSLGPLIFCHSNRQNQDLVKLESAGFIPVYYFWHGLISRDWFRHWKHTELQTGSPSYFRPYRFLMYIRAEDGTRAYRTKLKQALLHHKNQIVCDWDKQNIIPSDASASINLYDAKISSIQIVAETLFETDTIYVTEKCFKPMVMKQPFLIFAAPGTLEYLRSYGFKTFSDAWDESYDQEKDHWLRFRMLIGQIEQLSSMSKSAFEKVVNRCQAAIDHNVQHFFSQDFEVRLLTELDTNMHSALQIHGRMLQEDPGGSFFRLMNNVRSQNIDAHFLLGQQKTFIQQLKSRYPTRYRAICDQHAWVSGA